MFIVKCFIFSNTVNIYLCHNGFPNSYNQPVNRVLIGSKKPWGNMILLNDCDNYWTCPFDFTKLDNSFCSSLLSRHLTCIVRVILSLSVLISNTIRLIYQSPIIYNWSWPWVEFVCFCFKYWMMSVLKRKLTSFWEFLFRLEGLVKLCYHSII